MTRLILFALITLPTLVSGQGNLVPNGGFEQHGVFTDAGNPVSIATHWMSSGPACTPDYFSLLCPPINSIIYCSVPLNNRGFQIARNGRAYAGIHAFSIGDSNGREFLQVELATQLEAEARYVVSFHVSLADGMRYGVRSLGAYFSSIQVDRINYSITDLGITPNIIYNGSEPIIDTLNWVEVRDTFTQATGNERFLLIGNFLLDGESDTISAYPTGWNHSYYYIDDVSVIALDSASSVSEAAALGLTVYPNPAKESLRLDVSGLKLKNMGVTVSDMLGRTVMDSPPGKLEIPQKAGEGPGLPDPARAWEVIELNIAHLPPGLYTVEAHTQNGRVARQRVVKVEGP